MYISDLHIHSRYSRATSRDCTPEHLELWARRKGIHIVGSGDFTHPAWREELQEKLEPAEEGLYTLKKEYRIADGVTPDHWNPRFVITGEISSIYKKNGRVRKVHSLILLPGLADAERVSRRLEEIGNIHSDGRPILGLDCRDLLEILLELCPSAVYVPAHIWTPHFSLFGAFSGFDTLEECFEDLSPYVHALETGLSSDPPMNWRVSALDGYQLISNSDAHSPAKLGREANLMEIPLSYQGLERAIQTGEGLYGTIEFFPEEGKYHFDGHRKCGLCMSPAEAEKLGGICPVCGRKITIGVSHRVEQLADRAEGYVRGEAKPFESMVPLPEVIGASIGRAPSGAKVQKEYLSMLKALGPEFEILRNVPLEEIRKTSGRLISEGIGRLRTGKVERIPGFDGEYGTIRLFRPGELAETDGQMDFFGMLEAEQEAAAAEEGKKEQPKENGPGGEETENVKAAQTTSERTDMLPMAEVQTASDRTDVLPMAEAQTASDRMDMLPIAEAEAAGTEKTDGTGEDGRGVQNGKRQDVQGKESLNPDQRRAVQTSARRTAVIAGPGTGKTKTLIAHLLYLIEERKVRADEITAVTFTNQAAAEMRTRAEKQLGKKKHARAMQIGTFHALCLSFLQAQGREVSIADEGEARELAQAALKQCGLKGAAGKFLEMISLHKSGVQELTGKWRSAFEEYQSFLAARGRMDFDDLLLETASMIEEGRAKPGWEKGFSYLLVDEFQDINPLQYRLMKLWNRQGKELFVIGDPDQSIYGFRGADAGCFGRLQEEFPETSCIGLVENYRSTEQILRAALCVISENPGKERTLHPNAEPEKTGSIPVRLVHAKGSMAEAIFVAKEINRLAGGIGMLEAHAAQWEGGEQPVRGFGEIAVLYRTHRQGELLEKCLRQEGIPCIVAGREDFLQEESVRGSLAFFRYLEHAEDDGAAKEAGKLLWGLEPGAVADEILRRTRETFEAEYHKLKPQKFLEFWNREMKLSEDAAMKKLIQMTVFYKTMPEFLNGLRFGVESDLKRCPQKRYCAEAVTLMTLHGSKGLEFPVTFICGVQKGLIPFESEKRPTDREEERRLFYVGMTRAREALILVSGGEESEFTEKLTEAEVEREKADRRKNSEFHQMSLFEL